MKQNKLEITTSEINRNNNQNLNPTQNNNVNPET